MISMRKITKCKTSDSDPRKPKKAHTHTHSNKMLKQKQHGTKIKTERKTLSARRQPIVRFNICQGNIVTRNYEVTDRILNSKY